jgi:signal transduction histidine kinase
MQNQTLPKARERRRKLALIRSRSAEGEEAIFTIDEQGTITSCDAAAEHVLGCPALDLIGRQLKELIGLPHGLALDRSDPQPAEHRRAREPLALTVSPAGAGMFAIRVRAIRSAEGPVLAPLDLARVLARVADTWAGPAHDLGVSLELSLGGTLPALLGDEELLHRALDAIVRNSLEANESRGGHIRIAAEAESGGIAIAVEDDGPGFPAGFEPFRLFASRKPGGMGIGLALARHVARAHKGLLELSDRAPTGAVVRFHLPAASGQAIAEDGAAA